MSNVFQNLVNFQSFLPDLCCGNLKRSVRGQKKCILDWLGRREPLYRMIQMFNLLENFLEV